MSDDQAVCRGCGTKLNGSPYHKGGTAYVRRPDGSDGERAKKNYYGGWVCSRRCDHCSSLELEQSMPGHGFGQTRIGDEAMRSLNNNWPDY